MTPDYASLDAAIVKAIRDGASTFRLVFWNFEYPFDATPKLIRSRLQSLRKRGLIVYNNGRWSAMEKVK